MEKACSKCKIVRPLEDFHRNNKGLLGRAAVCKKCVNKKIGLTPAENMRGSVRDLTGQTFGQLTVLAYHGRFWGLKKGAGKMAEPRIGWDVICSCGKQFTTYGKLLTGGKNPSCGDPVHRVKVTPTHKACKDCKKLLPLTGFLRAQGGKYGRNARCKPCHRAHQRERLKKVKSDPIKKKALQTTQKVFYQKNRDKLLKENNIRDKERLKWDLNYKLRQTLRRRLSSALRASLKGGRKAGSAVQDLGCTIEFFKEYMESLFKPGMTWNNWGMGPGNWNIDHIWPISVFDLTNRQHLVLACHYLNMQPLWYEENMAKLNKLPLAA